MSETGTRTETRAIPLEFPKTINGVSVTEIILRRLTAREVSEWMEKLRILAISDPDAALPELPIIDAAPEILDQLDDDDRLALEEARNDFLPRRLQQLLAPESGGSPRSNGKPTEQSSAETSAGP